MEIRWSNKSGTAFEPCVRCGSATALFCLNLFARVAADRLSSIDRSTNHLEKRENSTTRSIHACMQTIEDLMSINRWTLGGEIERVRSVLYLEAQGATYLIMIFGLRYVCPWSRTVYVYTVIHRRSSTVQYCYIHVPP